MSPVEERRHTALYDDGDVEQLDLSGETWRFFSARGSAPSSLTVATDLPILSGMLDHFGNRAFMRHGAQGFPSFETEEAYAIEEADFKRTCQIFPLSDVPSEAKVFSSHVLYKVEVLDDRTLKMKLRIAPNGNEDSQ